LGLNLNDYKNQIIRLLPKGQAWEGPKLHALVQGFAPELQRADAQIEALFSEALPSSTNQCIPDWERIAGLPDAAFPVASTLSQRQGNLVAKLSAQGGQSAAYFIAIALRLGYTITIEDCYRVFAAGFKAGDSVYDTDWAFTFTVHCSVLPVGEGTTTNWTLPILRQVYNPRLEAVFNALKPAHTIALFTYPA
jgi:uncharacterized protein YmfQ (DUF2313 family)